MDLTCIVGTFGARNWINMAKVRAIPSAESQGIPVIHVHADTLAQARNQALQQVRTEFVGVCDADDCWEPGYAEAMEKGTADIRCPGVRQVSHSIRSNEAFVPQVYNHHHQCVASCLRAGNWLIVGAVGRTELLQKIAWEEWAWSEDWAFWARCYRAGYTFEGIPEAVYEAHLSPGGRNRSQSRLAMSQIHRQIERAVWHDEPAFDPGQHPAYGVKP